MDKIMGIINYIIIIGVLYGWLALSIYLLDDKEENKEYYQFMKECKNKCNEKGFRNHRVGNYTTEQRFIGIKHISIKNMTNAICYCTEFQVEVKI